MLARQILMNLGNGIRIAASPTETDGVRAGKLIYKTLSWTKTLTVAIFLFFLAPAGAKASCSRYCNKCTDPSCAACDPEIPDSCRHCKPGFGFSEAPSGLLTCEACADKNCLSCDGDMQTCRKCGGGFELDNNGMCVSECAQTTPNCRECEIHGKCSKCMPGFRLSSGGACMPCNVLGCAKCDCSGCTECLRPYEVISNSSGQAYCKPCSCSTPPAGTQASVFGTGSGSDFIDSVSPEGANASGGKEASEPAITVFGSTGYVGRRELNTTARGCIRGSTVVGCGAESEGAAITAISAGAVVLQYLQMISQNNTM